MWFNKVTNFLGGAFTKKQEKPPITNCHTHVFIGESIPPKIGKAVLPWPFYELLTIPLILGICRFYYTDRKFSPYGWKFQPWCRKLHRDFSLFRAAIKRCWFTNTVINVLNILIIYHTVIFLSIDTFGLAKEEINGWISALAKYNLGVVRLYFMDVLIRYGWVLVLFTMIFLATGRQIIYFIFKRSVRFFAILPSKATLELLGRYINIGRFAYYKSQLQVFYKLQAQYPLNSRFVILPMDMEFMEAGKISGKGSYWCQMDDLKKIKNANQANAFPFIAVDPRREVVADPYGKQIPFLRWSNQGNGVVKLEDCFIQEYVEKHQFCGFKIYPALGYYPFDELLLPLWKYAADNAKPILTHCIRGSIYFRGRKKKEWNEHPVFKESSTKDVWKQLLLPDVKNQHFTVNFTHPLNYLCLLEERLLRVKVSQCSDDVKILFGYTDDNTPLKHDLKNLKICLGHYGGDDEWLKYFESDRDNMTNQLVKQPGRGVTFCQPGKILNSWGTLELIWKGLDWYTLISSLMLQYPNVYADISYIVHNEHIVPLLKATLKHDQLKRKILFGTDFYVVRNHKSEKQMLAEIQGALTEDEFDLIARTNPESFLKST